MNDFEKVTKGLACCAHVVSECVMCPYKEQKDRHYKNQGGPCTSFLADDALPLLYRHTEADSLLEAVEQVKAGRVRQYIGDGFEVIRHDQN